MSRAPLDPTIAAAFAAAERKDFARAVDLLGKALARAPRDAGLRFNRAVLLQQLGRNEAALSEYDAALALNPLDEAAWFNRGVACDALARTTDAVTSYDRVLALAPGHLGALCNRGAALAALGHHGAALSSFETALAIAPGDVSALYNAGNVLRALDRPEDALAAYVRAIALRPSHGDAWNNRGLALEMLERHADALACFREAIRRAGDTPARRLNCASALRAQNLPDEALVEIDAALRLAPEDPAALLSRAITLLTLGRYGEGWPLYEQRWLVGDAPARPAIAAPLWLGGEDISGASVLLHGEQGYGDVLQFIRFAGAIAARGAQVRLHVQPALANLLRDGLTAPIAGVTAYGEPVPATDFHIPVMSLAFAVGARLDTVATEQPYIVPAPHRVAAWRTRLTPGDLPRIGLAWRGDTSSRANARRAVSLDALAALCDAPAHFVSLQLDLSGDDERDALSAAGVKHFGADLRDFRDTAAVMALCDLVITIDTSVCHLAGAMGRPVWIMLRHWADWRWLIGRDDSPWLPTARLFRQTAPGDWGDVIARVRAALDLWLARRTS